MFEQHPKVEMEMDRLCRQLARFFLTGRKKEDLAREFYKKLDLAVQRQEQKGAAAT